MILRLWTRERICRVCQSDSSAPNRAYTWRCVTKHSGVAVLRPPELSARRGGRSGRPVPDDMQEDPFNQVRKQVISTLANCERQHTKWGEARRRKPVRHDE